MGIRERLRRLEERAEEEMEAFTNWFDRLGAGDDAPPEHPMLVALRNTSDPVWQKTFFYVEDPDAHSRPVSDLSE